MIFRDEQDVRAWVRAESGGKARWVEPSLGSTPGLPDCWVPRQVLLEGQRVTLPIFIELKVGEVSGSKVNFTVRPEQRREIKALVSDGFKVGLLVGVKGTKSMLFVRPTSGVLSGMAMIKDSRGYVGHSESKGSFWDGVNSVFLD